MVTTCFSIAVTVVMLQVLLSMCHPSEPESTDMSASSMARAGLQLVVHDSGQTDNMSLVDGHRMMRAAVRIELSAKETYGAPAPTRWKNWTGLGSAHLESEAEAGNCKNLPFNNDIYSAEMCTFIKHNRTALIVELTVERKIGCIQSDSPAYLRAEMEGPELVQMISVQKGHCVYKFRSKHAIEVPSCTLLWHNA